MVKKKNTKSASKAQKTKPAVKKQKKSLFRILLKWGFVAGIWMGIALTILIVWYGSELPKITKTADFTRKATITIKDSKGKDITKYGDIKGNTLTIDDIPQNLIQAVLATEDRRFYYHFGIDPIGIARAATRNLVSGGVRQGGSTITQQLAKNLFLSRERTLKRKIQEAILAVWLERELSKDEILSAYLNRVYLGSGTYGVDAAAQLYFNKHAQDLNLLEAATIAGLLKAPSRYSPHNNPERALTRAKVVLSTMVAAKYITQEEAENAETITITKNLTQPLMNNRARYFTDWVVSGLDELIGPTEEDLIVYTTLNSTIQTKAEDMLVSTIETYGEDRKITQGATIVMRPDGAVVAMVGGKDYSNSQFNRAIQAKRQPGSSFKPFVFLTALEQGWEPDSLIMDEPFERKYKYRPENYGKKYYGEVSLTEALALSMNTAAVRLMKEVQPGSVIKTAKRLGIHSKLQPDLSLSLGSSAVSILEITTAYSTLANGGMAAYPYAIRKITNKDGEQYYVRPSKTRTRRVIETDNAADITAMLQTVVQHGTGQGAKLGEMQIAGKTGTSQESRDAWFIGYTNRLVTTVWLGNDDNTPMKRVTGGSLPTHIWRGIMTTANRQYTPISNDSFTQSGGLKGLLERILNGESNEISDKRTNKEKRKQPKSYKLNE